jgi:hypothetical protein
MFFKGSICTYGWNMMRKTIRKTSKEVVKNDAKDDTKDEFEILMIAKCARWHRVFEKE